ncbi:MAG: hypothetical protein ACK5VS_12695, partial [Hyphomonadaceae bacterium]
MNEESSMKTITTAVSALALMSALAPVCAFAIEPAWVGARAGTNGVGGEVGVRILPTVVLRGVGQGY